MSVHGAMVCCILHGATCNIHYKMEHVLRQAGAIYLKCGKLLVVKGACACACVSMYRSLCTSMCDNTCMHICVHAH